MGRRVDLLRAEGPEQVEDGAHEPPCDVAASGGAGVEAVRLHGLGAVGRHGADCLAAVGFARGLRPVRGDVRRGLIAGSFNSLAVEHRLGVVSEPVYHSLLRAGRLR